MRTEDEWAELARDVTSRVAAFAPDWTDAPSSDPGITLLQLFAFLAEDVLHRPDLAVADRARIRHLLASLERTVASPCDDATLTRPNYYMGKVLGVEDFAQEQAYHRAHRRRHNRLLHGVGIVRGLEVDVEPGPQGGPPSVVVSPGVAISPAGDEVVTCEPMRFDLCSGMSPCHVTIALLERPVDATVDGNHARIEETAAVATGEAVGPDALAIARLVRDGSGGWRLDGTFRPHHVG
jgi:hypothetical protein